jgi:hypothetical protein
VWLVTFLYAALAAVLVQLVVLPHLLPTWHAGSGLLVGGDWIAFHNYAVGRAARIRAQGWGAFELRPMGQAPVGIASAVYALTWSEPWTLIPLNAALHATAAVLLCHLLHGFVMDWRWAAIGTAPFVFYPTALVWVAQIHKDGFAIAGYFCLFAAFADLAREDPVTVTWRALGRTLLLVPIGLGLIWLVRPDLIIVAYATAGLALGVLAVGIAARIWRDPRSWRPAVVLLALVTLTTLAGASLTNTPSRLLGARDTAAGQAHDNAARPVAEAGEPVLRWDELQRGVRAIPWYRSTWLPTAVDRVAYRIALIREVFLVYYLDGQSTVDIGVGFYRASDLLRYLPRALQIALLAPFPTHWRETGSLDWTIASRRVVAIEMLGVYAALLPLPAVIWRWRRRTELWIVVLPCLAILGVYSLVVPNLGALHRFRYGFLMVLVGLGIAGGLDLLSRRPGWKARCRPG